LPLPSGPYRLIGGSSNIRLQPKAHVTPGTESDSPVELLPAAAGSCGAWFPPNRNRNADIWFSPAGRIPVTIVAPPSNSGTPQSAAPGILERAKRSYREITAQREKTARRISARLGIVVAQ
jgi:hypothetical protein